MGSCEEEWHTRRQNKSHSGFRSAGIQDNFFLFLVDLREVEVDRTGTRAARTFLLHLYICSANHILVSLFILIILTFLT